MSKKIGMIYFIICFSFAILVFIPMFKDSGFGFLQTSNTLNSTNATAANSTQISKPLQITSSNTKASTNGTSVDIDLQIKPFPVTKNVDTQFMITFLQPSTQSVQVHVDYDFAISKMNKEVLERHLKRDNHCSTQLKESLKFRINSIKKANILYR